MTKIFYLTTRKLIFVAIIFSFFCMNAFGQNASKIKLLIHSGISFASYPSNDFSTFYNPALNYGIGISYLLSSKMSLILNFNHYRFIPKEKWGWYISFDGGLTHVKLKNPYYIGDVVYEFNDLIAEFKIKLSQKRFVPYFLFGGGASYRRNANTWSIGIYGRKVYFSESIFYLVTTGLGFEYRINKKIDIFLEAGYNYCFFKNKHHNTGVTPLKVGIACGL